MPIKTKFKLWLHNLIAAFITGASTSGLASLGIIGASVIGVDAKPLDLRQLGLVALSGGIVGLLAYLKQSPVPPVDDTNADSGSSI